MPPPPPIIYLLAGPDEYGIQQELAGLQARLGDPATASMNTLRLDGRSFNPSELLAVAGAVPFLARRRLVILEHPTARLSGETARYKFLQQLEEIPPSTALVLVEYKALTVARQREKSGPHWLEQWVSDHRAIALLKEFPLPDRAGMHRWILEQFGLSGGQITAEAAWQLEQLVGVNKRLAVQEINKLLAYAGYQRPVEREDVLKMVADASESDIFVLVEAIGIKDRTRALAMLRRLMEDQDSLSIFGMVVRQFRMLLLSNEILSQGGGSQQVVELFKIPFFAANKILAQARQFSLSDLEAAYHRLLEADESVKSGEMPADLSLEVLVVELTGETPLMPIQK